MLSRWRESAAVGRTSQPPASFEARALRRLLVELGNPPIEFELGWSGERVTGTREVTADGVLVADRVKIADRATLFDLVRDPYVRFGDAYGDGRIDVDGDLVRLVTAAFRAAAARRRPSKLLGGRMADWLRRPRGSTLARARDNVHRHYDLGNEFYALWLGETMAYTCAYYPTADTNLDHAQIAKMDHVCQKVGIRSSDSVVEAGCGWGGLALHMAAQYGANVRAFNISKEQLEFARRRAKNLGLDKRVEFIEDDYRNIRGSYDVFMSVGMLEHVGRENYAELGKVIDGALNATGRGLIHSIGRTRPERLNAWIEQRIFPGAYPPSLGEMMQIFEPVRLAVLDVENLRLHYVRTLRDWLARYEQAADTVRGLFDETFVRMWRLYLIGSLVAFDTGLLQLFQVSFTRHDNNAIPLTREHLYRR